MKTATYTLMALNAITWACLSWSGLDGMRAVRAQHVPGYPSHGQLEFYVVVPLVVLAVSITVPLLLSRTRWARVGVWVESAILLLLLPFGFFYTGGM